MKTPEDNNNDENDFKPLTPEERAKRQFEEFIKPINLPKPEGDMQKLTDRVLRQERIDSAHTKDDMKKEREELQRMMDEQKNNPKDEGEVK